jgi:hypothetical protein
MAARARGCLVRRARPTRTREDPRLAESWRGLLADPSTAWARSRWPEQVGRREWPKDPLRRHSTARRAMAAVLSYLARRLPPAVRPVLILSGATVRRSGGNVICWADRAGAHGRSKAVRHGYASAIVPDDGGVGVGVGGVLGAAGGENGPSPSRS